MTSRGCVWLPTWQRFPCTLCHHKWPVWCFFFPSILLIPSCLVCSPGSGHNGYTNAVDGEEGGGEGEEEEEEGGEGDGGGGGGRGGGGRAKDGQQDDQWDEELDGEADGEGGGVRMTRTDTLHSTTSSTGTQRRRGQHAKKQVSWRTRW